MLRFLRRRPLTGRPRARRLTLLVVLVGLCVLYRFVRFSDISSTPDAFAGLVFEEDHGELIYPARNASEADPTAPRPPQPHPIHFLIREAQSRWEEKLARQSRTLDEAVAEYRRRYGGREPPRGFDDWFRFAMKNKVQLVDEYDSIMERILPFAAIRPDVLQHRSAMLQNTTGEEEYWMHKHTVTVRIWNHQVTGEGPMQNVLNRTRDMVELLSGISQFLPDLNMTMTAHDAPFITISAEHREKHIRAALAGEYINDESTHTDISLMDGWAVSCPVDSPIRQLPRYAERTEWAPSDKTSFIGLDHVKAMDMCYHPEYQPIHGFTAFEGSRPGLLYPFFSLSATSVFSDLLLPPLEQYGDEVGPDPPWHEKKQNKLIWRGGTTGSDLTIAHARKYSQRVRLARLPHMTGKTTVPLARDDDPSRGILGPVKDFIGAAAFFASKYLDIRFFGYAIQCGSLQDCLKFEKEFEWVDYTEAAEQNEFKYVLDVDGNGWSGRFHRIMSSNALVLKSTIFPEWYSDRIQPWVHYVPVKLDYTDLLPILSFFIGSPLPADIRNGRTGAHDDLAERIATAGKEWAGQYWRKVDMQVYLWRLLLEYQRVMTGER
ncbi:hypothetical protein JCM6882_003023 [Rhodosporidiobolus microsporus]